jgi:predicted acyl esterase
MARYHKGLEQPEPLKKGRVYKLAVDLWSTAIVFAPGHQIGLTVTSSEVGRYAVHPNSYEPVDSYEGAPVAHNRVHVSAAYPSRLILPVIAPGVSADYDPRTHRLCTKLIEWDK